MKLVRFGDVGREKPGMIDANGAIRDLSSHIEDVNGQALQDLDAIKTIDPSSLPMVEGSPRI